jgi:monofunctional biosynthetic peptidoglycan transglycosylase
MAPSAPTPLFDFRDPDRAGGFAPLDDAGVDGRSSGRAVLAGGALRFEGEVSPEAGGVAAIRSAPAALDLSGASGLALRVRGDGRRYQALLGTADEIDGATWQAAFETATGGWEVILLPLDGFAPVVRGRPAPAAGPLRPDRIRTMGLRLSDGQAGPFRLEVAAVAGYRLERGAVALPRPASPR